MAQSPFYRGDHIYCQMTNDGIAELVFDHKTASVNKFDAATLKDLQAAVTALQGQKQVKGLIIKSAKEAFIVGADITEFLSHFQSSDQQLTSWLLETHRTFAQIEDLPFPTVAAVNSTCLGGGFELALTTCYRVASLDAQVGLPETKLGIYPGWGGTIRLPRLIGADNAIEWIAGGSTYDANAALTVSAVDSVVARAELDSACRLIINQANAGKLDWQKRRNDKIAPLQIITPTEAVMVFEGAKAFVGAKALPHYPAPIEAVKAMEAHARKSRDEAAEIEVRGFVKMAKTPVAESLVTIFLSDQFNKKKTRAMAQEGSMPVRRAGVLGAGIMGGGIAYQSASRGVPVVMKDITDKALEQGLNEAGKLLHKQLERQKITTEGLTKVMAAISPTLSYGDFEYVDLVVEAVVENEKIKKAVYQELEAITPDTTVIASNTSTISINRLARGLRRPENFCGMHFFNPVPLMPLVEVIKGEQTSDKALATTVAYALKMGKTPIVVNDCPGFLVNRVLFPYFFGFAGLVQDGVDFKRVDKVMEKWGWPMGPAYLLDVVGIDTAVHAAAVMAEGFPERMRYEGPTAMTVLKDAQRFGQKNGQGFYSYTPDKKGKPKKGDDPKTAELLRPVVKREVTVSDDDIIDRMMIPMINESARCLAEKIVATPMEVDLGVLYGIGFPPFRGGVLKYADSYGLARFVERAKHFASLGACYEPAPLITAMVAKNEKFYRN